MLRITSALAVWALVLLVVLLGGYLAVRGAGHLSAAYLVDAPRTLGTAGGIGPILVNTGIIVGSSLLLAVPIALGGSLAYAAGGAGTLRRGFRLLMEIGLSLPRLLWGLAGASLVGGGLGLGYSALTGILTLTALLLPILITGFMSGLARAAQGLLPACRALGIPKWRVWVFYVLPSARPGLLAAVLLASGRACGDAAALYLTAGIGMRLLGGLDQSASTLAVHVFKLAVDVGGGQGAAFAAAFVLLVLTVLLQAPLLLASSNAMRSPS